MMNINIVSELTRFELELLYRVEGVDEVELNRLIVSNLIFGYNVGDCLVFEVSSGSSYGIKVEVTKYEEFEYEFTIKEMVYIDDEDIY